MPQSSSAVPAEARSSGIAERLSVVTPGASLRKRRNSNHKALEGRHDGAAAEFHVVPPGLSRCVGRRHPRLAPGATACRHCVAVLHRLEAYATGVAACRHCVAVLHRLEAYATAHRLEAYATVHRLEAYATVHRLEAYATVHRLEASATGYGLDAFAVATLPADFHLGDDPGGEVFDRVLQLGLNRLAGFGH